MNPLQYVPFNQTLYFINGDDPAQVAWMKRQTPPTLESKIILVQGSIPEMQKSLDSRVYFDQNGVLCQRLGIDQVPARVSAVPGDRFLKVEFIPATAATANWWTHCFPSKLKSCVPSCVIHRRPTWWKRKSRKRPYPSVLCWPAL